MSAWHVKMATQNLLKFTRQRIVYSLVRSLGMLLTNSLTHSLTNSLPFSKLDWCDPGLWRCQLKTCWGCYCCWSCWQQFFYRFGSWRLVLKHVIDVILDTHSIQIKASNHRTQEFRFGQDILVVFISWLGKLSSKLLSSWAFQQGLPQSMWALDDGVCKERQGS